MAAIAAFCYRVQSQRSSILVYESYENNEIVIRELHAGFLFLHILTTPFIVFRNKGLLSLLITDCR